MMLSLMTGIAQLVTAASNLDILSPSSSSRCAAAAARAPPPLLPTRAVTHVPPARAAVVRPLAPPTRPPIRPSARATHSPARPPVRPRVSQVLSGFTSTEAAAARADGARRPARGDRRDGPRRARPRRPAAAAVSRRRPAAPRI